MDNKYNICFFYMSFKSTQTQLTGVFSNSALSNFKLVLCKESGSGYISIKTEFCRSCGEQGFTVLHLQHIIASTIPFLFL